VDFDIGVAPEVGYLRLEYGQTDLPNPDVTMPSAQYLKLSADPRWARVLQNQTNVDIWYLAMNVHMAPFTNKLVREAFNMIVNKANQVRVLNGRGVINNGIQAPTMPGFQDQSTYNPLSLDQNGQNLTMAKQLLAQAGYSSKHPFPKVALVYPKSSDTADQLAASVQQDFASAGVNLTLQGLAFASYLDVVGKPKTTALSYGGWIQDFPDPSDFVDPILSCSAANVTANGSNQSFYCSKQVDQLADQARGDNNKTERTQLYKQIQDIVVTQDFPWVPMYTDVQTNVAAPRVHGYHISPVWLLTFNNIWVTGPAPSS
jgi:ABC-type transport system substrate-binding protein